MPKFAQNSQRAKAMKNSHKKTTQTQQKQNPQAQQNSPKQKATIAPKILRLKAFLIDLFIIYTPILYIFYFYLGSKEAFLQNQAVILLCVVLFGGIQGAFFAAKAQSPGLKAYDLYLINAKNGRKAGLMAILFRYLAFLVGSALVFGLMLGFLRKDGLCLHDLLSRTCIVRKV